MIGPLLRIATASLATRSLRESAAQLTAEVLLVAAAIAGGSAALFCFTVAGLTVLERTLDPAGAWAIVGGVYTLIGLAFYFAATRRRR